MVEKKKLYIIQLQMYFYQTTFTFSHLADAFIQSDLQLKLMNFFQHSPSGKLVQIEYALSAVAAGAPSVGIKGMFMYMNSLSFFSSWTTILNVSALL